MLPDRPVRLIRLDTQAIGCSGDNVHDVLVAEPSANRSLCEPADMDVGLHRLQTLSHDEPLKHSRTKAPYPSLEVPLELRSLCPPMETFLVPHADAIKVSNEATKHFGPRPKVVAPESLSEGGVPVFVIRVLRQDGWHVGQRADLSKEMALVVKQGILDSGRVHLEVDDGGQQVRHEVVDQVVALGRRK
jgi:hypothetical protein